MSRLQLGIRIVAFLALGLFGISFGTVFLCAFVALPAIASVRLSTGDRDRRAYLTEDGPRIVGALRWFAAIAAWASLLTDRLPDRTPQEVLSLSVDTDPTRTPTPGAALLRIITGIPSAIVLGILGWIGLFVWLWAALTVLVTARIGEGAHAYLVGVQRWSIRLLAYQAALVDEYPPFSFAESPPGPDAVAVQSRRGNQPA
ncbi:MAG: DUF4389 domain-containing protein [Deltaproteobacteria bacterium]|nr:DUF4389 domain-containing protein [Deltaproteobacteria bacterium]